MLYLGKAVFVAVFYAFVVAGALMVYPNASAAPYAPSLQKHDLIKVDFNDSEFLLSALNGVEREVESIYSIHIAGQEEGEYNDYTILLRPTVPAQRREEIHWIIVKNIHNQVVPDERNTVVSSLGVIHLVGGFHTITTSDANY